MVGRTKHKCTQYLGQSQKVRKSKYDLVSASTTSLLSFIVSIYFTPEFYTSPSVRFLKHHRVTHLINCPNTTTSPSVRFSSITESPISLTAQTPQLHIHNMNFYLRLRNLLFGRGQQPTQATNAAPSITTRTRTPPTQPLQSSFIPLASLRELGRVYWQTHDSVFKWLDHLPEVHKVQRRTGELRLQCCRSCAEMELSGPNEYSEDNVSSCSSSDSGMDSTDDLGTPELQDRSTSSSSISQGPQTPPKVFLHPLSELNLLKHDNKLAKRTSSARSRAPLRDLHDSIKLTVCRELRRMDLYPQESLSSSRSTEPSPSEVEIVRRVTMGDYHYHYNDLDDDLSFDSSSSGSSSSVSSSSVSLSSDSSDSD